MNDVNNFTGTYQRQCSYFNVRVICKFFLSQHSKFDILLFICRSPLTFCCLQRLQRSVVSTASFHSTPKCHLYRNTEFEDEKPKKIGKVNLVPPNWLKYNDVVYPPTEPGEPERPAVCMLYL